MHPEAKAVSWNWTGPGKLDCNTISVNGCTSITLASTVMGIEKVRARVRVRVATWTPTLTEPNFKT